MVEILCTVFLWLLFALTMVTSKKIYSPAPVFTLLWAIILTLYCLHVDGLYYADEKYIIFLLIGIISYWFGCQISSRITLKRVKPYYNMSINEKVLQILAAFSMIVLGYGTVHNLRNISLSVYQLRYGGGMNISVSYIILRDFFAVPIVYVCVCFFVAQIVVGKLKLKWALITIILVLLDLLALFEQACIYAFVCGILFVLFYMVSKKRESIKDFVSKKMKKYFKFLVVVIFLLVVLLVQLREIDFFSQIYHYVANSITLFSIDMTRLESLGRNSYIGMYTYGLASFQGVVRIIFSILEGTFGYTSELFESASYFYATYLAEPQYVVPNGLYNSFATMFIYFYKDFGFAGIPILSFAYGTFSQKCFDRMIKRNDIYSMSLYVFVFITIFFTYIQSPFTDKKFAFAIVILMLIKKRDI